MIEVTQFIELNQVAKHYATAVTEEKYDDVNVCINLVQYTSATRSAFAYERPAFAYVIIFTFNGL